MGAALDTGKGKKGVRPNINVTPLVDVVLVLLIIFMVIIPNMQDGKPIEMINVLNPDKDSEAKDEPLTVTIDRNEHYVVDDAELPRAQAIAQLQQVYANSPKRKLLIRADAKLHYAKVREFFKDVQNIGFGGVALAVGTQRKWDGGAEVK
ncbi:biopolymer transporter ExbD [Nannocystis sp.]|uniref:ExbD/TolR family protein n=1 Tax=Nannocystis sp. TaxID=1962667 RepID=UPI002429EA7C|nr:biopolymer transporter ExbD [Nannocystis sp.]MBK7824660.1 biopolymer transporter ExbD [Nannocystis sp.]MBK9753090.1 biopolymer transporter ExbD [Nannocystis sp.]